MKYLSLLLIVALFSSCSVVSRQTYYVPSVSHQTIKDHGGYFKMLYSRFGVADSSGKSIGTITTSNGIGNMLLMGPPFVPVIPVGFADVFYKQDHEFLVDININCNYGYFTSLAIDSNEYKTKNDSLKALNRYTAANFNTTQCYMIVNNSKKVPLHAEEFFMGSQQGHKYRLQADVRFSKVKTMRLVTGNAMLDSTLKNITFTRKHRFTYCVIGPS